MQTRTAEDGKQRLTDLANVETLLRLVQSVPSPKAEPIKIGLPRRAMSVSRRSPIRLWRCSEPGELAQAGPQREMENPAAGRVGAQHVFTRHLQG
jgi:hypothetical protein